MAERADPIGFETIIVDPASGKPTTFFIQQWNSQLNVGAYAFNNIVAGNGLEGGGALADGEVTIDLPLLGSEGTFGSATQVPVITVDTEGRITGVTLETVTATVAVEDNGAVLGDFSIFNFLGTGVTLTDAGGGQLDIDISGGGVGTIFDINAGVGLTGGGNVGVSAVTIDLANTAVTPGTFGSATQVPQITVDPQGRLTNVSLVTISGGGGGGTPLVVQDEGVDVETDTQTMDFRGDGVVVTRPSPNEVRVTIAGGSSGGGGGGDVILPFEKYVITGSTPRDVFTIRNQSARSQGFNVFCTENCTIESFDAAVSPLSGHSYNIVVAEMSDATDSATIVAIVGTTEVPAGFGPGDNQYLNFPFTVPIELVEGKVYYIGMQSSDGLDDPRHSFFSSSAGETMVYFEAPLQHLLRWRRFDPTNPAIGDTYSSSGNGTAMIVPKGFKTKAGGGGGGTSGPARGARLELAANVALGAFTPQVISWETESFDDADLVDLVANDTRITVPSGVTRMSFAANAQIASTSGTDQIFLQIRKNGTDSVAFTRHESGGTRNANVATGIIDVVAGDYFEVVVESSDAANLSANSATFFAGQIEEVGTGGGSGGGSGDEVYEFAVGNKHVVQSGATSGSAFAAKGTAFESGAEEIVIDSMTFPSGRSGSATYTAQIVILDDAGTNDPIQSVVATSNEVDLAQVANEPGILTFTFTNATIPANSLWAMILYRTDGTGTAINRGMFAAVDTDDDALYNTEHFSFRHSIRYAATSAVINDQTFFSTAESIAMGIRYRIAGAGSGGGGTGKDIAVQQDGANVVVSTDQLNFKGGGVIVTNPAGDNADIQLPGPDPRENVTFTYDPVTGNLTQVDYLSGYQTIFAYDPVTGDLLTATSTDVTKTFNYDPVSGNLTSITAVKT